MCLNPKHACHPEMHMRVIIAQQYHFVEVFILYLSSLADIPIVVTSFKMMIYFKMMMAYNDDVELSSILISPVHPFSAG